MSKRIDIDILQSPKYRITTIGAICDEFGGDVQTGPFGSQLHAADYSEEGVPVVMPQDMVDGRIVCDRIARVAPEHVLKLSRHMLREGDLVFSRRGDVSRFAVVTAKEAGWLCGTGSIRIRLNCSEILTNYARRYLQQAKVGAWLLNEAKGITMPNLNTKIIRALPFVYPSISEQRRIAAILDQADTLRAKRREALAQLDSLTQSIFIEMFGDPATNPKRWPWMPLGAIASKFSDGPFGSNLKSEHYVDAGVRVIRLQNIGVGEFVDKDKAYISNSHFESIKKHECKPGDVLVGTMGDPNLRACLLPETIPLAINKADCVQIRVDTRMAHSAFICALLNHPSTEVLAQDLKHGQTRVRISMGSLRGLEVPVPPVALQNSFADRVNAAKQVRAAQIDSLDELDALFSSLQHRAFRGEL